MLPKIDKIKGIHPGIILKREISKRGWKNKDLALMVNEHAQTISAILKAKRSINPKLSIKLGLKLEVESDYFMLLQASFDIKQANSKYDYKSIPDIRKVLFWDTDFSRIDWMKNRYAIVKRIFERGNSLEISEIINFYGYETVKSELQNIKTSFLPAFDQNVEKYISR
ncbi:MAG: helix-turn-helix domain-containing protein [Bacteroidales bacterium]|nr:helix-turn-helix domain-containing protein [Bacteroidales bacterium]MCF8392094.1 helix-turn-helix domain-containing protein [Bacteroidales bacterium]